MTDHGGGVRATLRSESDLTGGRTALFDAAGRRVASTFAAIGGIPPWSPRAQSADGTGAFMTRRAP